MISPPGAQADMTRYSVVYFARPEDEVLLRPLKESEVIRERAGNDEEEAVSSKEWVLRRALGRIGVGYKFEDTRGTEDGRGRNG